MPHQTPALTIGLPVYNGQRFLRLALDSILGQTYSEFELLVSDNGSTDATQAICDEYAKRDPRIRYVRHPVNRGVFWNVDYVMRNARGKFFMLVGDDDIYEPTYIETLLPMVLEDENVGLAYSNFGYITSSGNPVAGGVRPLINDRQTPFWNCLYYLSNRSCLPLIFGIFRTEVCVAALPFVSLGKMTGDVDNVFMLRVLSKTRVRNSPQVLFYYRLKDRTDSFPDDFPLTALGRKWYVVKHYAEVTRHFKRVINQARFTPAQKTVLKAHATFMLGAVFTLLPMYHSVKNAVKR